MSARAGTLVGPVEDPSTWSPSDESCDHVKFRTKERSAA